jgi:Xaa-Pro aminopeptidase
VIQKRLSAVRGKMEKHRLQAMLVTEMAHVRYLTGFSGSQGMCVVTTTNQFFLTDGRYRTQAPEEVKDFTLFIAKRNLFPLLGGSKILPLHARIGFESQHMSVADLRSLKKLLPGRRFIETLCFIEDIAAVKDDGEVELIRSAARISDKVFQKIIPRIRPGVRECEIAAEISYYHQMYGAERDAFDPIVASGERGALPHARASEKKVRHGEMVILDFGCRYQGYHSDLTRTVAVGKPLAEMKKIYQIVYDAQKKAIDIAAENIRVRSLDAVARRHIRKHGFGRYFTHALGHGLGIHVQEPMRISALSSAILKKGNVVTVEPGIYIPGYGGVRIEDDIVIHHSGCEVLTRTAKELFIV